MDDASAFPSQSSISVLDGIAALVDNSLVYRIDGSNGAPRFGMLETIREFGLEQLDASGMADAVWRKHAAWCLGQAEESEVLVRGSWHVYRELDRLEVELGNFRAALAWLSASGDSDLSLRLAGALGPLWFFRGHVAEGRRWMEATLTAAGPAVEARARALVGLGVMLHMEGSSDIAVAHIEEALAGWTAVGDGWGRADALLMLGWMTRETGDYERASRLLAEALAFYRDGGGGERTSQTLYQVGIAFLGRGDMTQARAALSEALALAQEGGYDYGIGQARNAFGSIACDDGDFATAATAYRQSISVWQQLRVPQEIPAWFARVAVLAAAAGRPGEAARLFGTATALRETEGAIFGLPERGRFDRGKAIARGALGDVAYEAGFSAGRALPLEHAFAEASDVLAALVAEPEAGQVRSDGGGLTRREREVLRYIVDGATDREIAEALSISPRTVGAHVVHILSKIDVETRRAARRVAIERRLV